jgi:hypothetical protein
VRQVGHLPELAVIAYFYSRVYPLAHVLIQDSNRKYLHTGVCAVGLLVCFRVFAISVVYGYKQSDGRGDV